MIHIHCMNECIQCDNLKAVRRLLLECQSSIFILGCVISLVWFYVTVFFY